MCVAIILLLGLGGTGSDWLKMSSTATLLILCEIVLSDLQIASLQAWCTYTHSLKPCSFSPVHSLL